MSRQRKCLICRERCIDYYGICPNCQAINDQKRLIHKNLNGYTALVTGGRIRIGYATCLRLLRDGASVIALTRYPYQALMQYRLEPDFEQFKDRLIIYGFDLKRVDRIDILIDFVKSQFPQGLDILVNNAAQTIKKPPSYYQELEQKEQVLRLENSNTITLFENNIQSNNFPIPFEQSAELCETPTFNSWVAKAEEVSPQEMLEVQLINVTAPFLFTAGLKNHMSISPNKNKFVINVSSVEGRFNQKVKLARHVHTNMAKASLNMMTHSLALDFSQERIFMYSCDPGWVSNQFPKDYEISRNFKAYLSFDDAATRICYPIYLHIDDEKKPDDIGCLYKDYKILPY